MSTILIIDDEQDFLDTVEFSLKKAGYIVETAVNGKEGYQKVVDANPDLILLDIMMPEWDGITVLSLLKSTDGLREIPIIMLTAKGETRDVMEALDLGADDYIIKPFEMDDLTRRMSNLLTKKSQD